MPVLNKHKDIIPFGSIYVGRPTKWGNPYPLGKYTREQSCDLHEQHLSKQIELGEITLEELAALHDKNLVCYCAPLRCHAHTLERAAAWAIRQLDNSGE